MIISQLEKYISDRPELTKIEITTELNGELCSFEVTKTKETYVFEDELSADAKVDELRQTLGFISVEKKYKQGKMSKSGEILKAETWSVIAKMAH